ncbi:MAG: NADH-quinone oxidoreductase subunit J, partial [Gammaproteobacteria bacterium]|nr:NADH-quinone oxidoreductase subunit J [Gammaproteobacteria bacterium]
MTWLFYIFSSILVYSALSVVLRRNPVVAVLHLVLAFASCAVLWLLLEAEFLAMSLILVYVGAVMVLFLFVIMMLEPNLARLRQSFTGRTPVALLLAAALVMLVIRTMVGEEFFVQPERVAPQQGEFYSNTYELGWRLFDHFLYPFELAGLVLLMAIVSAIYLNLRTRPDSRRQKPADQIRVASAQRLRMVHIDVAQPSGDDDPSDPSGTSTPDTDSTASTTNLAGGKDAPNLAGGKDAPNLAGGKDAPNLAGGKDAPNLAG